MQELLLFGQVRSDDALLSVLTGLTGMQPQRLLQRHAVYRPNVLPTALSQGPVHVGGSQQISQDKRKPKPQSAQSQNALYSKLVETLPASYDGSSEATEPASGREWVLVNNDEPLPGQRPVIQRTAFELKLPEVDAHQRMLAKQNVFVSEYVTDGARFTHHSINVYVYRIRTFPQTEHLVDAPRSPLPALDSLALLDPSGAYLVEASVKLEHEPTPKLLKLGTDQLLGFQRDMQGVVKLVAPDRLSLDTRVKAAGR